MQSKETFHRWMTLGLVGLMGSYGLALQGCKKRDTMPMSVKAQAQEASGLTTPTKDISVVLPTKNGAASKEEIAPTPRENKSAVTPSKDVTEQKSNLPDGTAKKLKRLPVVAKKLSKKGSLQGMASKKISRKKKRKPNREGVLHFRHGGKRLAYRFREGKREGEWVSYYNNGRPRLVRHYKAGRLHGVVISFFRDGKKRLQRSFQEGKRDGQWMAWDKKGTLLWARAYEKGKLHGPSKRLFKDRETEIFYVMGKRKRQRTIIYKQGKKRTMLEKDLENELSKWVAFYPNGNKKTAYQESKGKRHGVSVEWFANGKKKRQANYDNGDLHGKWKCWNESGTWSMEGEYRRGRKHGDWSVWRAAKAAKKNKAQKDQPKEMMEPTGKKAPKQTPSTHKETSKEKPTAMFRENKMSDEMGVSAAKSGFDQDADATKKETVAKVERADKEERRAGEKVAEAPQD